MWWSVKVLLLLISLSGQYFVRCEDDIIIETSEEKPAAKAEDATGSASTDGADPTVPLSLSSPDADVTVYFTFPLNPKEIPANKPVRLLVGFRNKGNADFHVDYLDASLRYPMDYSYIISNLTSARVARIVRSGEEATIDYGFFLHEAFAQRPFTLSLNLHYQDLASADRRYTSAVYNETINVVELDEGLDSQTFFLYVIFAAILVLLGLLAQHYWSSLSKKRPALKRAAKAAAGMANVGQRENGTESGTIKSGGQDVDFDWLPESTLRQLHKSPKKSPTQSRSPQQSPKATRR